MLRSFPRVDPEGFMEIVFSDESGQAGVVKLSRKQTLLFGTLFMPHYGRAVGEELRDKGK